MSILNIILLSSFEGVFLILQFEGIAISFIKKLAIAFYIYTRSLVQIYKINEPEKYLHYVDKIVLVMRSEGYAQRNRFYE